MSQKKKIIKGFDLQILPYYMINQPISVKKIFNINNYDNITDELKTKLIKNFSINSLGNK